jgi:hypothetical protein
MKGRKGSWALEIKLPRVIDKVESWGKCTKYRAAAFLSNKRLWNCFGTHVLMELCDFMRAAACTNFRPATLSARFPTGNSSYARNDRNADGFTFLVINI